MLTHEDKPMTDTAIGQAYIKARHAVGGGDRYLGYMQTLDIVRTADAEKQSLGKLILRRMAADPVYRANAAELLGAFMRGDPAGNILKDMPAADGGGRFAIDDQALGTPASIDIERAGQTTGDNPAFDASAVKRAGYDVGDAHTTRARPLAHGGGRPTGDTQLEGGPARDRSKPGHAVSRGMRPELGRLCFLDSIRVNNQSLRDVTPEEALRWAEMRKLDARRIEAICFGLHPEKRIGDQITDKDADARAAEALQSSAA